MTHTDQLKLNILISFLSFLHWLMNGSKSDLSQQTSQKAEPSTSTLSADVTDIELDSFTQKTGTLALFQLSGQKLLIQT